ncbi:DUF3667 domain-containing protein [Siccationidurans ginsengisoli]|nr:MULTISPECIES: DUF3667 domain-containing protein [unclassified Hymenobacter]MBO2032680.1 DUF3667 domain-containing protein [Hymenobacter sp. BT559]
MAATSTPDLATIPGFAEMDLAAAAPSCASCYTQLAGAYCHACGEKTLHRHDYALKHFLEHTVDTLTHFDLRVLRDLWWQVRRPGFLAAEWLQGRRVRHAQPVQLFLITNLLFYLLASVSHFSPFETGLGSHTHSLNGYSTLANRLVQHHLQHTGTLAATYTEHFNQLAHTYSKSLVFLFIPLMVGPLWLLFWQQRRYFVEWIMLSTYLFAGLLLLYALAALLSLSGRLWSPLLAVLNNDGIVGPTMLLLTIAYVAAFFGGAFPRQPAVLRWGKALLYGFSFFIALVVPYRFVLFMVCYWAAS